MDWLNYHHFFYFWTVAREGSIAAASKNLRIAPPTISGQLKQLEESLGEPLFVRVGRGLELTEAGRTAYRYAEEIFGLGREMVDTLKRRPAGRPAKLVVGVVDALAKLVAQRLLSPARRLPEPPRLVVREASHDRLLAELSIHGLDLVLSDTPIAPGIKVKAFNHLLGECSVSVMGTRALVAPRRATFPRSLRGAPLLMPSDTASLRRAFDGWLDTEGIEPDIVGEFDDSALLKVFGAEGDGLFIVPTIVEREVAAQYHVEVLGRVDAVRERFYAISVERRVKHPAVAAICEAARADLFA